MLHNTVTNLKFEKLQGIEAVVFGLVLLFLPVNLAKHFFFSFAYVDGILVDYLIPTIYLTDILVGCLLFFWLLRFLRWEGTSKLFVALGFGVVAVSGLSVFKALNQPAAVYKWLKLVEYIFFAFYVSKHIDFKKDFPTIVKLLSVGVLFESVLAIAQWFNQGSVFGFWFFGENRYTVSTPGIATFDFAGVKKARPYGTTPHPNVLGGYLAVLLPWIFYEIRSKSQISNLKSQRHSSNVKTLNIISFILGLLALFLSFSRSAWVVGGLGLLAVFFTSSSFPFLISSPLHLLTSLSFIRRAELNWIALEMVKDHPLLGVGLNNFTVRMGEYGKVSGWVSFLQPVHNVYLLIAAEIGLVGLALFFGLLFSVFRLLLKKKNYLLLISMAQITLLCLTDHYFWTLQQTSLLFWLLVGLVFSAAEEKP